MNFPEAFSLRGETALITGGGTGIGLAMAKALHAAGAKVVLAGRREAELVAAVKELGAGAGYVVHDVNQLEKAPAFVTQVEKEHGPVTCLVNNAGQNMKKPAVDTTSEELEAIVRTHI